MTGRCRHGLTRRASPVSDGIWKRVGPHRSGEFKSNSLNRQPVARVSAFYRELARGARFVSVDGESSPAGVSTPTAIERQDPEQRLRRMGHVRWGGFQLLPQVLQVIEI